MCKKQAIKTLIVDDEEVFTYRLARSLRKFPHDIRTANSGNDALDKFKEQPAEIMITDIRMPGINGLELTKLVLEQYPDTVVIVITGHGEIETAVEAIKLGAIDFLQKPLSIDNITTSLKKAEAIVSLRRKKKLSHSSTTKINLQVNDATMILTNNEFASNIGGYQIVKHIGEGAYGTVYLVENSERNLYAMKTLRIDLDDQEDEQIFKRFENEAEAISKINHPNIIAFKELNYWGPDNIRLPYIIMEYFEGKPLGDLIDEKNDLTIDDKVYIISQIASALECVHEHNIYHRDIKPANILISQNLKIKIADFGICHLPDSNMTHDSNALGTPYYLAPETMSIVKKGSLLDIYSLGVVAYELFLGIKPFIDYDYERLMYKVINEYPIEPIKVIPGFPVQLQKIIGKMLQKKTEQRYQHARDIVDDLVEFSKGKSQKSLLTRMKGILFSHKVWE